MKPFKDIKECEIFFEDSCGEYCIKMDDELSYIWDFNDNTIFQPNNPIEMEFPLDLMVYTLDEL